MSCVNETDRRVIVVCLIERSGNYGKAQLLQSGGDAGGDGGRGSRRGLFGAITISTGTDGAFHRDCGGVFAYEGGVQNGDSEQNITSEFSVSPTDGLAIDSATSSQGGCTVASPSNATCDWGLVPAGQTVTFRLVLTALKPGDYTINDLLCGSVDGCKDPNIFPVKVVDEGDPPPPPPDIPQACRRPGAILGDGGDNRLVGASRPEVICGLGGNDRLIGRLGDDSLLGGDGNDILDGRDGKKGDRLHGGPGRDVCYGNKGDVMSACEQKIRP